MEIRKVALKVIGIAPKLVSHLLLVMIVPTKKTKLRVVIGLVVLIKILEQMFREGFGNVIE